MDGGSFSPLLALVSGAHNTHRWACRGDRQRLATLRALKRHCQRPLPVELDIPVSSDFHPLGISGEDWRMCKKITEPLAALSLSGFSQNSDNEQPITIRIGHETIVKRPGLKRLDFNSSCIILHSESKSEQETGALHVDRRVHLLRLWCLTVLNRPECLFSRKLLSSLCPTFDRHMRSGCSRPQRVASHPHRCRQTRSSPLSRDFLRGSSERWVVGTCLPGVDVAELCCP
jgi:hypothetical protein